MRSPGCSTISFQDAQYRIEVRRAIYFTTLRLQGTARFSVSWQRAMAREPPAALFYDVPRASRQPLFQQTALIMPRDASYQRLDEVEKTSTPPHFSLLALL